MSKPILFIDDDEIERRTCVDVLKEVFDGTGVEIEARAPLRALSEYSDIVANDGASAFVLDEKMSISNTAGYTGAELAEHLREIGGDRPIFIFTNYPDENFSPREWAFESVVPKKIVMRDPHGSTAVAFRERLCRQIKCSNDMRSEADHRYHELLVKSTGNSFTPEEDAELRALEERRILPVAAAERERQQKLDAEIENLKRLLGNERIL